MSNHVLPISRRNAFVCIYSNICPKLVAMSTPLWPLCTGVSQMNSPVAQTLSQNQTLHGYVAYNWSHGNFGVFLHLGQNLAAMATSLRPLQCLTWTVWPQKPLLWVITSSVSIAEMHLYALIAILVQKMLAMVMPLCILCKGVSQMNSTTTIAQNLSHHQTLHGCIAHNWSMANLWYFCLFWPQIGCHGNIP